MRCRRRSAACSSTACEAAFRRGELGFFGELAPLAEPAAFAERMRALRQSPFVVYAKPPFGGPERVLAYLARYTHRTAIANSRLVAVDDDEVAFSYKDYRRGGRSRIMRLAPHEFIRRFLLHVLPDGFHRIRHYGFLAKGDRGEKLAHVRDLLQVERPRSPTTSAAPTPPSQRQTPSRAFAVCPDCGGLMRLHRARRAANPAPFAATHHDHERRPDLDRLVRTPPRHCAAGAELQRVVGSLPPRFGRRPRSSSPPEHAQTPAAERSNRSTIARRRLRNAAPGVQNQTVAALSP